MYQGGFYFRNKCVSGNKAHDVVDHQPFSEKQDRGKFHYSKFFTQLFFLVRINEVEIHATFILSRKIKIQGTNNLTGAAPFGFEFYKSQPLLFKNQCR